ncbi:MAG: hypothetical protein KF799_11380 [Bdellovibrionales bacterium]|nr:hypothetical protein [Bdellovibrionales bacterium]
MKTQTLLTPVLWLATALISLAHAAPTLDSFTVQGYMKKANNTAVSDGTYTMVIGVRQNGATVWAKSYSIAVSNGLFSRTLTGAGDDLSAGAYSATGMQGDWSGVSLTPSLLAGGAAGAVAIRVYAISAIDGTNPSFDITVASVPTSYIAETAKNVIDGSIGTASMATGAMTVASAGAADDGKLVRLDAAGLLDISVLPNIGGGQIDSGTVGSAYLPTAGTGAAGIVDTSTQTFAGVKTFADGVTVTGPTNVANLISSGTGSFAALDVSALSNLTTLAVSGTSHFAGASAYAASPTGLTVDHNLAVTGTASIGAVRLGGGTSDLAAYAEAQTCTMTVTGTTVAGTPTFTTNVCYYTKIGKMVFLNWYFVTSGGTGTGNMTLTGLPETSLNQANLNQVCTIGHSTTVFTGSGIKGVIAPNSTTVTLRNNPVVTTGVADAALAMDTTVTMYVQCNYLAN